MINLQHVTYPLLLHFFHVCNRYIDFQASNLCEGGLESSELVGCYSHRGPTVEAMLRDDSIGLIETTVVGLEPARTYRFDLLATPLQLKQAQSLPYRTVWVRTANSC
ncbi:hypothetical protein Y032_0274g1010 [Ancylostoma ceylanicum]|uniref:Uncharacterized protein n=1 Tax=Ancylostoma ceylanicum TaxID=53326 RepID=A0A016S7U9_9BILA|nr:hypothetical protein Y032_0274g1010 [Ancylostoma ceylanicum]